MNLHRKHCYGPTLLMVRVRISNSCYGCEIVEERNEVRIEVRSQSILSTLSETPEAGHKKLVVYDVSYAVAASMSLYHKCEFYSFTSLKNKSR